MRVTAIGDARYHTRVWQRHECMDLASDALVTAPLLRLEKPNRK